MASLSVRKSVGARNRRYSALKHDCPSQIGLRPPGRQWALSQPQRLPSLVRSSGQSHGAALGTDTARSFGAGVRVAGMTTGCTATFRAGGLCLTAGAGSPSKQAQPASMIANPTSAIRMLSPHTSHAQSPHEQGVR